MGNKNFGLIQYTYSMDISSAKNNTNQLVACVNSVNIALGQPRYVYDISNLSFKFCLSYD